MRAATPLSKIVDADKKDTLGGGASSIGPCLGTNPSSSGRFPVSQFIVIPARVYKAPDVDGIPGRRVSVEVFHEGFVLVEHRAVG